MTQAPTPAAQLVKGDILVTDEGYPITLLSDPRPPDPDEYEALRNDDDALPDLAEIVTFDAEILLPGTEVIGSITLLRDEEVMVRGSAAERLRIGISRDELQELCVMAHEVTKGGGPAQLTLTRGMVDATITVDEDGELSEATWGPEDCTGLITKLLDEADAISARVMRTVKESLVIPDPTSPADDILEHHPPLFVAPEGRAG